MFIPYYDFLNVLPTKPTLNYEYNSLFKKWQQEITDEYPTCEICETDLTEKMVVLNGMGWTCIHCWIKAGGDCPLLEKLEEMIWEAKPLEIEYGSISEGKYGSISEGTVKPQDLLPTLLNELRLVEKITGIQYYTQLTINGQPPSHAMENEDDE